MFPSSAVGFLLAAYLVLDLMAAQAQLAVFLLLKVALKTALKSIGPESNKPI